MSRKPSKSYCRESTCSFNSCLKHTILHFRHKITFKDLTTLHLPKRTIVIFFFFLIIASLPLSLIYHREMFQICHEDQLICRCFNTIEGLNYVKSFPICLQLQLNKHRFLRHQFFKQSNYFFKSCQKYINIYQV